MKKITCRGMGGMCDEPLMADSYEGIIKVGMEHLKVAHPEMAKNIESMPKDAPAMIEWEEEFKKTWAETPEM